MKPGTTATEAEAPKNEKYRELIDMGYSFPLVAMEVLRSLGERNEVDDDHNDDHKATDFNGFAVRQCGLCFTNCERRRCV